MEDIILSNKNNEYKKPKLQSPEQEIWIKDMKKLWLDIWQPDPLDYGLQALCVFSVKNLVDNNNSRHRSRSRSEAFWLGWSEEQGLVHQLKCYSTSRDDVKPVQNFWYDKDIEWRPRLSSGERWAVPKTYDIDYQKDVPLALKEQRKSQAGNFFRKIHIEQLFKFYGCLPQQSFHAFQAHLKINKVRHEDIWMHLDVLQSILGESPSPGISISEAGKRRSQFVSTYPVIGNNFLFAKENNFKPIDSGERSLPLLAQTYGVSENTIKFVSGIQERAGVGNQKSILSKIKTWDIVVNATPRENLEELKQMHERGWEFLASVIDLAAFERNPTLVSALKLEPGEKGAGIVALSRTRALAHFPDVVSKLSNEVFFPYLALGNPAINGLACQAEREKLSRLAQSSLLGIGLKRTVNCIQEHLMGEVHHAAMGAKSSNREEWGELAEPVVAPTGLTMRFLKDQEELNKEGSVMKHCVASYGAACAKGNCAIMSIGEWNNDIWHPCSTVEIKATENSHQGLVLSVNQHYGVKNNPAPQQAKTSVDWWLKEYSKKNIKIKTDQLKIYSEFRTRDITPASLSALLGEGWNTPEAFTYRWDRWRRLLTTNAGSAGEWLNNLKPALEDQLHFNEIKEMIDQVESLGYVVHNEVETAKAKIEVFIPRRR